MTKKKFMKRLMSWRLIDRNRANEFADYVSEMRKFGNRVEYTDQLIAKCVSHNHKFPECPPVFMCMGLDRMY